MRWNTRLAVSCLVLSLMGQTAAEELRGVVVRTDAQKGEVLLEGRGKRLRGSEIKIILEKDTAIRHGKKTATVGDLTPGRRVRVVYESVDGQRRAARIQLLGSEPAAEVSPQATVAPAGAANTVAGVLRRVAYTEREIVVIQPGGKAREIETTVFVPEQTRIVRNQKPIAMEDLHEDEHVAVEIQKRGRQLVAQSIVAGGGAKAPPASVQNDRKIERARQILKLIDGALQQIEDRTNRPPDKP